MLFRSVGDVTADAVSRNLIYCVDEETSKIKTMVIEVLNTETGNLDFITIPAHLQFAINNDVYQRLYEAGIDVPQIIKMSNLNEYFNNDTSYEYGMLLLEDYFDIRLMKEKDELMAMKVSQLGINPNDGNQEDETASDSSTNSEDDEEMKLEDNPDIRFPKLTAMDMEYGNFKPKNYGNSYTLAELIEDFRCF